MNSEENRLQTFHDWPIEAIVSSPRIAKAGFYYTNQNCIVECFSCCLKISEWSDGDHPMARHRYLRPDCEFVRDPSISGNIPVISSETVQHTESMEGEDYKDEQNRLETFANWPYTQIVTPNSLARAGFYFVKLVDFTKCAFCDGVAGAWELGDDPDFEHKRLFPDCWYVTNVISPRLRNNLNLERGLSNMNNLNFVSDGNLADLGVHAHKGPKRPKYNTLDSRLITFSSWPEDLIQTPDILAQAGFYYEGRGDEVRCFHCDGGLKNWDPHDEPWTEHARWFPNCGFILLLKGKDFISACAPGLDLNCRRESHLQRSVQQKRQICDSEVKTFMTTQPALAALNLGLHVGRVKQAIREKLESTGSGFSTSDALIEATLNLQREEVLDDDDEEEYNVVSRHVSDLINALQDSIDKGEVAGDVGDVEVIKEVVDGDKGEEKVKREELAKSCEEWTLEEENRLLREARLCKICMDSEVGIVFLPCGHLATCINCAPNLSDCPVCRASIKATVRTFLS